MVYRLIVQPHCVAGSHSCADVEVFSPHNERVFLVKARRFSLLALALVLVSLLALAACGGSSAVASSPTPTPSPTATPLVNTVYTSTDGAYSIKIPATWKTEALDVPSTSGGVSIVNATNTDAILVEPFTFRTTATVQSILGSAISDPSSFTGSKVDATTTTKTYPSGSWTVATATTTTASTTGDGVAVDVQLYMTEHDGHTVVIITFAQTTNTTEDQTTYFDPMLMSFTFLK